MSRPTVAWDETSPPGTQAKNFGPARLRELKTQVREIIGADHKFESSGQHANMGFHNKATFLTGSAPTHGADKIILYGKDVGGKCELFARDEDGDEVQITSLGKVSLRIPTGEPGTLADGMIWFEE